MGKLDETSTLAGVRGRLGGLVVSSNQSGGYVRPWFIPRNPKTPEQTAWLAKFAAWAAAWRSLTPVQVSAWDAAATGAVWTRADWFGQPYQPSGFNLWMMVCSMRDSVGLSTTTTPPSAAAPSGAFTCSVELYKWYSATPSRFRILAPLPVGAVYAQLEVGFYNSIQTTARSKPYRPLWAGTVPTAGWVSLQSSIQALIGRTYAWTGVWYRYRALAADITPGAWQTGDAHASII